MERKRDMDNSLRWERFNYDSELPAIYGWG
jgi:hypothetical protein